ICSPGYPRKSADDIIEWNCCNHKIVKVTFLKNDAWNARCGAAHVKIGYVVPLQYKNNIFWIFKTAIIRNCEKLITTCGMLDPLKQGLKQCANQNCPP
ncbi:MAG: hypothetical protein U9N36_00860, partial [Euryarchaeota archaeon]|nr:hypothetical protein [Euryarchaeota archaeon]